MQYIYSGGGGSGLGLWICQKIANYHHGELTFHSEGLGKGTTFQLKLPVYHAPEGYKAHNSEYIPISQLPLKSVEVYTSTGLGVEEDDSPLCSPVVPSDTTTPPTNTTTTSTTYNVRIPTIPVEQVVTPSSSVEGQSDTESITSFRRPTTYVQRPSPFSSRYTSLKKTVIDMLTPLDIPITPSDNGDGSVTPHSQNPLSRSRYSVVSSYGSCDDGEDFGIPFDRPIRILLVDDSSTNRKIIKRMLLYEKLLFPDLAIDECDDGTEAIEKIKHIITNKNDKNEKNEKMYDYILLDSNMTKMHGSETALILRQKLQYKGVLIGMHML